MFFVSLWDGDNVKMLSEHHTAITYNTQSQAGDGTGLSIGWPEMGMRLPLTRGLIYRDKEDKQDEGDWRLDWYGSWLSESGPVSKYGVTLFSGLEDFQDWGSDNLS